MKPNELSEAFLLIVKRLFKWIAFGFLGSLIIFSIFFVYNKVDEYYQGLPKIVTSLKEIELGEKLNDFIFKNPGFTLDDEKNKDSKINEYSWYINKNKSLSVAIGENKVQRIVYLCSSDSDYSNVNQIQCNSKGEAVVAKYGKDVQVRCLKDKNDKDTLIYRVYDAPKYGIRHHIISNNIVAFEIKNQFVFENDYSKTTNNWIACS